MSDTHASDTQLIINTAQRIFIDLCDYDVVQAAEEGHWPEALHKALLESGLTQLGLAETGTRLGDFFEFLRVGAAHAAPLPLLEWGLAQHALAQPAPETGLVAAQGNAVTLVWPEQTKRCLVFDVGRGLAGLVDTNLIAGGAETRITGEPCVAVTGQETADFSLEVPDLYTFGALGRCAQMCGALERILEITLSYAGEREQFGRSISKFQAIQHQLAVMAAEVAAARRATDAAIHSCDGEGKGQRESQRESLVTNTAVAKVRVGEAAGVCAEIAHQVHGAMGFTMEYQLHHFTRRLWFWRDDFGTENEWAERVGDAVCDLAADDLWSFVARHG